MRKLILSLIASGTALAFASPAAAQYYPAQQQPYGYGAPQYGYGYNSYGAQNLVQRVDAIQRQIKGLQRAHILRGDRAQQLRREASSLERRIRQTGAYGFNGFAQGDIQAGLARLEQHVRMAASAGRYGGYGYNNGFGGYANGYGQQAYGGRDRDDDDRYDGDRREHDDNGYGRDEDRDGDGRDRD